VVLTGSTFRNEEFKTSRTFEGDGIASIVGGGGKGLFKGREVFFFLPFGVCITVVGLGLQSESELSSSAGKMDPSMRCKNEVSASLKSDVCSDLRKSGFACL
jgi:hypothetical protein